tara:strand:+ start:93976 stop:95259 length:1284 start_codon:yes stop_codon:yes gene_type:complete
MKYIIIFFFSFFTLFSQNSRILEYSNPDSVGISSLKIKEIDFLVEKAIDSLMIPGAQILIARDGQIFFHKAFGYHTYKKEKKVKIDDMYDLASLTKILVTLPLIIQEVDKNEINLENSINDIMPEWSYTNKKNILLQDILTHYARLIPWIPFYTETQRKSGKLQRKIYRRKKSDKFSNKVAKNIFIRNDSKEKIIKQIFETDLRDTLEMKYSDFPFIMMQSFLEKKYDKTLDEIVNERIFDKMNLKRTMFNPNKNLLLQNNIVPSEIDNYFRNQELKGYVHDMAAAMFGGIAGHAGLFSNSFEVGALMQMYLNKGNYGGKKFFSSETFEKFNNCIYCDRGNRRGLGFDKPQIDGSGSTCGCVSRESFGHSGFTGTYAWADPKEKIIYVFLSNRTYPSMENTLLIDHSIRTRIQKIIYDSILIKKNKN